MLSGSSSRAERPRGPLRCPPPRSACAVPTPKARSRLVFPGGVRAPSRKKRNRLGSRPHLAQYWDRGCTTCAGKRAENVQNPNGDCMLFCLGYCILLWACNAGREGGFGAERLHGLGRLPEGGRLPSEPLQQLCLRAGTFTCVCRGVRLFSYTYDSGDFNRVWTNLKLAGGP